MLRKADKGVEAVLIETDVMIHPQSWMAPDHLGEYFPDYLPTFSFAGEFIDKYHERIGRAPLIDSFLLDMGIDGWLIRQDGLKLYELAYFCHGDVIEQGSHHGLSTSILAAAVRATNKPRRITSIEILSQSVTKAQANNAQYSDFLDFMVGDAGNCCHELRMQRRQFGLAFVDHAHDYAPVFQACEDLKTLIVPGGMAIFHDYNDGRNGKDPGYGVYQAVNQSFSDRSFTFCGIYGCTGLFRRAPASRAD